MVGNRKRVLSLLSQFREAKTPSPTPESPVRPQQEPLVYNAPAHDVINEPSTPPGPSRRSMAFDNGESPEQRSRADRPPSVSSRPLSMVQTYQPPLMDVNADTLPELQPIFTYLNSHGNKLYQEGYFLKLDDQNIHGKANADRTWTECFAQLVGTVLSLWDAAELDAAGNDGEVLPKFINLTDSSIKMIEALPTRSDHEQPLQNVLSISTAGKNRYLFHFNSHHSLVQWTAGIRLAMFEHMTLQEAYTGALIAGKGLTLNNISEIMQRTKMPYADWARVRFGAGTPWRRCWCVVSPPDEKEYQKMQKQLKKRSVYDRSRPPTLTGDIKFFDSKKTKRARPIATITDAFSAYAIYPQSKPLIDASTLVKLEGSITIHSSPPTKQEGFVFVMPEVPPAVSGFEMMLRWLFPVLDTFGLYGRPGRLIADTRDSRGFMFAMPKHRRYGYLENLDVSTLVAEEGSAKWKESEWRKKMKELTGRRMATMETAGSNVSRYGSRRMRNSFGHSSSRVHFDDAASTRSQPTASHNQDMDTVPPNIPRADTAPIVIGGFTAPRHRAVSEAQGLDRMKSSLLPKFDGVEEEAVAPAPPPHLIPVSPGGSNTPKPSGSVEVLPIASARGSSDEERHGNPSPTRELSDIQPASTPEPVNAPPAFAHSPGAKPPARPYHSPELRRENSRLSVVTLSQLHATAAASAAPTPLATEPPSGLGIAEGRQGSDLVNGLHEYFAPQSQPEMSARDTTPVFEDAPEQQQSEPQTRPVQTGVYSHVNMYRAPANHDGTQGSPAIVNIPQTRARTTWLHSINQARNIPAITPCNPSGLHMASSPLGVTSSSPHNLSSTSHPATFETSPQIFREHHAPAAAPSSIIANPNPSSSSLPPPRAYSIARKPLSPPNSAGHARSATIETSAPFDLGLRSPISPMSMSFADDRHVQGTGSSAMDRTPALTEFYANRPVKASGLPERSPDKPRAGVLKTIGHADGTETAVADASAFASIDIDFGPTFNYATQKPGVHSGHTKSTSADGKAANSTISHSVGGPRMRPSSVQRPISSRYFDATAPDFDGPGARESRFLAWQPTGTDSNVINAATLSAEEFVQQRAAMANAPQAAMVPPQHRLSSSAQTISPQRPRPYTHFSTPETLPRPKSRGASSVLSQSALVGGSGRLSAQQQAHMSRVTGQPLISMATKRGPPAAVSGLVSAIEGREQEKAQMKQDLRNHALGHSYARNQQAQLQQQHAEQAFVQQQHADMLHRGATPSQHARHHSWSDEDGNVWPAGMGPPRTSSLPQNTYGAVLPPAAYPSTASFAPGNGFRQ